MEPAPAAAPYGYNAVPQGQNTMAVVSLVFGILGLTFLPLVGSIVALVTARSAKRQISQTGQAGAGMATAGVITGWIGIAIGVVTVVLVIIFVAVLAPLYNY
jgi:hypothetical protein